MNHGGYVWINDDPCEWLDFSANLRPEGPPQWVRETFHVAVEKLRFYPDPDMKRARKGLAAFLDVPDECVLPTAGGMEAIDLALSVSDGRVFFRQPTFCEYAVRAAVHGRENAIWAGQCDSGDFLVLCNPNNPTGETKPREDLLTILDTVRANGGNMIVDEAFIEYCPEHSLRDVVSSDLIVLGSFSKILGTPGIRLGYLCASAEMVARLLRRIRPWSLDAAATEIAVQLPNHKDQIREDAELNKRRRKAFSMLLQSRGAEVYPSESNFLLVDFHRDMSFAAEELKRRKVLVRTCSDFGLPDSFWRLAVKTEEENAHFVAALEEILHEW